jgi:hypothetical protein
MEKLQPELEGEDVFEAHEEASTAEVGAVDADVPEENEDAENDIDKDTEEVEDDSGKLL